MVLTELEELFREIKTNQGETFLRYESSASPREKFSFKIDLENTSYTQNFAIST